MQEQGTPQYLPSSSVSTWAFAALALFAFVLPIIFVPNPAYPFQFSKVLLALVAVSLSFLFFAVKAFRSGNLYVEWSWLSIAFIVLPIAYLASAIFSSVPALSFFGYQLDQDTFGFMLLLGALALMTTLSVNSGNKILSILTVLLASGWIVLLFQAVQIFFNVPVTLGVFTSPIQNLVGKWNDFGLFASLIGSLSLVALESLSLSALRKIILALTLLLSVALLSVVNFSLAWILLGVVSFMTLLFSFMRRRMPAIEGAPRGTHGIASGLVLLITVFFVFFGANTSTALQNHFHIVALEVSPSLQGTLGVIQDVYHKSPIFGSGPNTFSNDWFLSRPKDTLASVFWATEFNSGVGTMPTAFATGGIVVALAWVLLVLLFVYTAVRALLVAPAEDERSYFLLVVTALGSAFLLASHFFYAPSPALSLMLFMFLGLFVASLRNTRYLKNFSINFSQSPRLGFLSVAVIAVAVILSVGAVYKTGRVYQSAVAEGIAVTRSNANDLAGAMSAATRASALATEDRYLRTETALHLAQLNAIVQSGATDDKARTDFQNGLTAAIAASGKVVAYDPLNYANWMSRASVYEAVIPLGIQGASENALAALEQARKANPLSPEVDYQEATIKAYAKDNAGAKTLAVAAIAKKADYTPAILLLAQISLNEGNITDAIASIKAALVFTPTDSSLLYELGLLQLQDKQYQEAANSFTAALKITPNFANAAFFLGETDVFLGNTPDALTLFKALQTQNPDNSVLNDVLTKLGKGQNPFATSTAALPPDTAPANQ